MTKRCGQFKCCWVQLWPSFWADSIATGYIDHKLPKTGGSFQDMDFLVEQSNHIFRKNHPWFMADHELEIKHGRLHKTGLVSWSCQTHITSKTTWSVLAECFSWRNMKLLKSHHIKNNCETKSYVTPKKTCSSNSLAWSHTRVLSGRKLTSFTSATDLGIDLLVKLSLHHLITSTGVGYPRVSLVFGVHPCFLRFSFL